MLLIFFILFFFFNDTATTEIYTLSLHDALPICLFGKRVQLEDGRMVIADENYVRESILNPSAKIVSGFKPIMPVFQGDRKSTRLNSSHLVISYAVFCLKKKNRSEAKPTSLHVSC